MRAAAPTGLPAPRSPLVHSPTSRRPSAPPLTIALLGSTSRSSRSSWRRSVRAVSMADGRRRLALCSSDARPRGFRDQRIGSVQLGDTRLVSRREVCSGVARSLLAHRDHPGGRVETIAFVAKQSRDAGARQPLLRRHRTRTVGDAQIAKAVAGELRCFRALRVAGVGGERPVVDKRRTPRPPSGTPIWRAISWGPNASTVGAMSVRARYVRTR